MSILPAGKNEERNRILLKHSEISKYHLPHIKKKVTPRIIERKHLDLFMCIKIG